MPHTTPDNVPLQLLVAEDSEDDFEILVRELRRGGYAVTAERVSSNAELVAALEQHVLHVVHARGPADVELERLAAPAVDLVDRSPLAVEREPVETIGACEHAEHVADRLGRNELLAELGGEPQHAWPAEPGQRVAGQREGARLKGGAAQVERLSDDHVQGPRAALRERELLRPVGVLDEVARAQQKHDRVDLGERELDHRALDAEPAGVAVHADDAQVRRARLHGECLLQRERVVTVGAGMQQQDTQGEGVVVGRGGGRHGDARESKEEARAGTGRRDQSRR